MSPPPQQDLREKVALCVRDCGAVVQWAHCLEAADRIIALISSTSGGWRSEDLSSVVCLPAASLTSRVPEPGPATPSECVLWSVCEKFIRDNRVTCAEASAEDRVYENAPDLVERIADIVGYAKAEG